MTALPHLVSEARLQETVVEMAERLGWVVWHGHDSRRNTPGFPDLVCVHPDHGVLWLELKTMDGRVRKHQRWWIDLLTAAGQRAYIIRPSDMDVVELMLRGGAR